MRFALKAGQELDLVSPEELASELDRIINAMGALAPLEKIARWPQEGGPLNLGAGGGGRAVAYTVPEGFVFRLHIVSFGVAYTVGTPSAQVAADLYLWRGEAPADGGPVDNLVGVGKGLPNVVTYTSDAPLFRGGERLVVEIRTGPLNAAVSGVVQGSLQQVPVREAASVLRSARPRERKPAAALSHVRDSDQSAEAVRQGRPAPTP